MYRPLSRSFVSQVFVCSLTVACSVPLATDTESKANTSSDVERGDSQGVSDSAEVDEIPEILQRSVHKGLDCSDCHAPALGQSERNDAGSLEQAKARCDGCHSAQAEIYSTSVHATLEQQGTTRAAVCAQCHGDHDIYPLYDPRSQVAKSNIARLCSQCHESPAAAPRLRRVGMESGRHYLESIHGVALLQKGLAVAPSCLDCHGSAHRILRAEDADSPVAKANVKTACGVCHVGALAQYERSEHARAAKTLDPKAPTCPTCHTAHEIASTNSNFRRKSAELCGECHSVRRDQYLDTYHGRAHELGDATVATCFNCHGAHSVLRASDPRSTVSNANRANTCGKCHERASQNFAAFMPHANHHDRAKYPALYYTYIAMTGLLVGTFSFFGVHTLLWFLRSMIYYFKHREQFWRHRAEAKLEKGTRLYRRFRPVDRFCHLLVITSFLLLVATGMPLKFHHAPWAAQIFDLLGGPKAAAHLHRVGAVMTFGYFFLHIASVIGPLWRRRREYQTNGRFDVRKFLALLFGPDSPAPNLQDLRDFVAHTKWFVGKGPKPTFDRFTYWEKFDYLAVFWGVTVIGLSGLVMWFPIQTTFVVPGWVINVAHVIHSDEALLAAGFIFTFHFFNGHFRPEKFPLDPVIFSGHITESEMRHERGRQMARLIDSHQLRKLEGSVDEWENWKWLFLPIGVLALLIGSALVIAIFWALLHAGH